MGAHTHLIVLTVGLAHTYTTYIPLFDYTILRDKMLLVGL